MQTTSESALGVGSEMLSDAKSLGATALDRVHSELDNRKSDAVGQVKSVSAVAASAAGSLDPAAPAWLKSALEQGASQIQALASSLEQKDSRELVGAVGDFARRSPGTFLAACAAVGFGAARVLKSGGSAAQATSSDTVQFSDNRNNSSGMFEPQQDYQLQSAQQVGASGGQLV